MSKQDTTVRSQVVETNRKLAAQHVVVNSRLDTVIASLLRGPGAVGVGLRGPSVKVASKDESAQCRSASDDCITGVSTIYYTAVSTWTITRSKIS